MKRLGVIVLVLGLVLAGAALLFWPRSRPVVQNEPEPSPETVCKEVERLPTGLKEPRGVAVGPDGEIIVVGDRALVVEGERIDLEAVPHCVAFDGESTLYVGMKDHVEVFGLAGERKAVWRSPGPDTWITSVAAAEEGVYAADFGTRSVLRYDSEGKLLGRIEGMVIPSPFFDVAVDPHGYVWVANTGKHTLEKYRSDGSSVASWSSDFAGCCNPSHFAIRPDGLFVTAEKGLVRMKLFSPAGEFIGVAEVFSEWKLAPDVAVDAEGRIHVLDPKDSSIRIYVEK